MNYCFTNIWWISTTKSTCGCSGDGFMNKNSLFPDYNGDGITLVHVKKRITPYIQYTETRYIEKHYLHNGHDKVRAWLRYYEGGALKARSGGPVFLARGRSNWIHHSQTISYRTLPFQLILSYFTTVFSLDANCGGTEQRVHGFNLVEVPHILNRHYHVQISPRVCSRFRLRSFLRTFSPHVGQCLWCHLRHSSNPIASRSLYPVPV